MNLTELPDTVMSVLPVIHEDVRGLFAIVMAVFIAAIIWHAHRQHRGW